jgi:hypothetical protein
MKSQRQQSSRSLAQDGRPPWDRQPGEPQRAYAAFSAYRAMPAHKRSLRELATQLSYKDDTGIARWSREWLWQFRCEQWDAHQERERSQKLEALRLEAIENHRREACHGQAIVMKALLKVGKIVEHPPGRSRGVANARCRDGGPEDWDCAGARGAGISRRERGRSLEEGQGSAGQYGARP